MGHSFAHCALHLIYFRLYSIADRSKSHRVLCGWLMWIQLYDRPIDRSNESHRSPFNVNLRWSPSRFDQSVASLFRAPIIESFSSPPPLFSFLLHPGKSNLRTWRETSADRETIIPLLSRIFYCNWLWFVKGGQARMHTIRPNGRNISSILIQRTRTMRSASTMLLESVFFSTNNWTQNFNETMIHNTLWYIWIH